MKIFITGFHRAGTHRNAQALAEEHGLPYLEEKLIRWDSMDAVKLLCEGKMPDTKQGADGELIWFGKTDERLKDGFVLQCPGVAHKTLELTQLGKVYWCNREYKDIVTSMVNNRFDDITWRFMEQFYDEFPNDPIWNKIKYNEPEDIHFGFVAYQSLFCKVKDHFYNKHFESKTTLIQLETQPFYNKEQTASFKNPLRQVHLKRFKDVS